MLNLSNSSNENNNEKNKTAQFNFSLLKKSSKKMFKYNILGSPLKEQSFMDKNEDENSEKEEDEATRMLRIRQERTDFLIKLLTEDTPKRKIRKNRYKLKPLNKSNFSLDKTLSTNSRIITETTQDYSKSIPKYLTFKEREKLLKKLKKEKEKREKEKEKKVNQEIMKEIHDEKKAKKRQIFRTNLNKLYGYNNKFLFFNKKLKKEKGDNLEKYQEDILKVSSINLSKDNMLKLFSDLKTIRINSEQAKPLPPINFKALVHHSLDENSEKKQYGLKLKQKKFSQMDEYEKEMYMIKTNNRHEKMNSNNNKFLYKMYEILPEHVVDTIYGKKRKF